MGKIKDFLDHISAPRARCNICGQTFIYGEGQIFSCEVCLVHYCKKCISKVNNITTMQESIDDWCCPGPKYFRSRNGSPIFRRPGLGASTKEESQFMRKQLRYMPHTLGGT